MRDRAHKVQRLLEVQRQLTRIEEWRLGDLERTLEGLATSQRELVAALNENDALHGLFLDALARRLRSLSEEALRVGEERQAQTALLLEHGARKACAERLAEEVALQVGRAADKNQLLDIIDRSLGPAAQASRKIAGG